MGLLRLSHERPEVTPDVSVRETVRIMAESHIGAIAVRKGAAIVGVFSERDLMKRVVADGLPGCEAQPVEAEQAGVRAQPEISVAVLPDRVDGPERHAVPVGPRGQGITGEQVIWSGRLGVLRPGREQHTRQQEKGSEEESKGHEPFHTVGRYARSRSSGSFIPVFGYCPLGPPAVT